MSEAELGAGPPFPCFDLNPALPLLGVTAQSWNCFHMAMEVDGPAVDREGAISVVWIVPRSKLSPRGASGGARSNPKRKVQPGRPTREHSRNVNEPGAQHPLRARTVAFKFYHLVAAPPDIYTFVGSLGCRDRRAVWLDRAPADINNIAGAATRR